MYSNLKRKSISEVFREIGTETFELLFLQVIHYQIRHRGEDALFSVSDETKVIHGLDELVYYYQNQPCSGLQHRLDKFVPNEKCPTSVRLHGVDNLLHRATQVEILLTYNFC